MFRVWCLVLNLLFLLCCSGRRRACMSKFLLVSLWSLWSTRGQHHHFAAIQHTELWWPVPTSSLTDSLLRLVSFRPCWSHGHPSPWTGSRKRDVALTPRTSASLLGTWGMALSWLKHAKMCPLSQVGVLHSYWCRNDCSGHVRLSLCTVLLPHDLAD